MVAIVAGNGWGLFNTSASILGSNGILGDGWLGQAGGQSYVNAATGNLVLQFQDEQLSGRGADLFQLRTYNSLGQWTDGNGFSNWRWDGERTVKFSGTVGQINTSGATITRVGEDGSETVYTWDGARYASTDGDGAHDFIKREGSQWVWTDGSTRLEERYGDSIGGSIGRLLSQKDISGNIVNFEYDSGRLARIIDLGSLQKIELVYSTTTPSRLTQVNTFELVVDGDKRATSTLSQTPVKQVEYDYDANGRLWHVKTVLDPTASTLTYYTTTYSYDGTSTRISNIAQSDGTSVSFTYDAQNRIQTVTDGDGKQTFSYGANSTTVTITDLAGGNARTWRYTYDSLKRLMQVDSPPPNQGGTAVIRSFLYDESGNVTQVTDGRGKTVVYRYQDGQGNRTYERDSDGNTITRTFNGKNQVETETLYRVRDTDGDGAAQPSGAMTSRFVYDSQGRLRFTISAEGRVSETRYGTGVNNSGLVTSTLIYAGSLYNFSTLGQTQVPSESDLVTWTNNQDLRQLQRSDFEYDFRGNISKRTDYSKTGVDGQGNVATDSAATVTDYIYDGHSALLQTIARRGTGRNATTILSSVVYDGLGRQTSVVSNGVRFTTAYDGAARTISVTNTVTGLVETRAFDTFGRLISIDQNDPATSGTNPANKRTTSYFYDAFGNLTLTVDPQGNRTFNFYDALGRLQYTVDSTGAVCAYAYDPDGRLLSETHYFNRATAAAMTSWLTFDNSTPPKITGVSKTTLVIGTGTGVDLVAKPDKDRVTTYLYDDAGRLWKETDAAGTVTTSTYDGSSRLTTEEIGASGASSRITRYFYDGDDLLVGTVDPLGYLIERKYDAAGRLVETVRYSTRSPAVGDTSLPQFVGVVNQTVIAGKSFSYRLPAFDADSDEVTFSTTTTLPTWLSFDNQTGTLSGTPPKTFTSLNVVVVADDGRGGTASTTVSLTAVNAAPLWSELPDANGVVGVGGFSYTLPVATDESTAAQLVYSVTSGNLAGLNFDAATRKITGTPTTAGIYTITVRVTDKGNPARFTEKSFTLTISSNALSWQTVATQTVFIGEPFTFAVPAALDPQGQPLTYSWVSGPSWLTFDPATRTFSGTPTISGPQTALIRAQNLNGEVVTLTLSMNAVGNTAPNWVTTLPTPAAQHAGTAFTYTPPLATDPENDTLTYSAEGLPAGLTINAATGKITGASNVVGSSLVTLTATDPHGLSVSRTITITFTNQAPVALVQTLPPVMLTRGQSTSWTIPPGTFADPDGDSLSSAFGGSNNPVADFFAGVLDGTFLFISSANTRLGAIPITVGVKDPFGASATITFDVVIVAGASAVATSSISEVSARAVAPVVDVLASWRPSNTDALHSYQYYDGQGRVVGSVDEQGFLTETVYNEEANQLQTIKYLNKVTVTANDTLNDLRSGAGVARTSTLQFDGFGRVSTTTAVDGTVTRYEYDSAGRLSRQVLAEGTSDQRASRIRYDAFDEITGTLSGVGDAWMLENSSRTLDAAIDRFGMRYAYDSLGQEISETDAKNLDSTAPDANGHRTLSFYDGEGRLTHTVNAKGEVTETVYNTFGQVQSERMYNKPLTAAQLAGLVGGSNTALVSLLTPDQANDRIRGYDYDQRGLLTSITDALGYVTTNTYTAFGQLETQTRTLDQATDTAAARTTTTRLDYDLAGELISQTGDIGGINFNTQLGYDAYGRVVRSVDGAGRVTRTDYQDGGRIIEVTDPLNRKSRTEFDAFGRVLYQYDAVQMGRAPEDRVATVFTYDDLSRRMVVTTPEGMQITTITTRTGETLSVTVGANGVAGNTTSYTYDKDGKVLTVSDARQKLITQKSYDNRGRLDSEIDARGTVTKYGYDELNRIVTRQVDPSGLNLSTVYEFDVFGQQVTVTEGKGIGDAMVIGRVTSYAFDRNGQLTTVTVDPDRPKQSYVGLKLTTTYKYDGLGDVILVTQGSAASPKQQATSYEFDKLGRRVKEIVAPSAVLGASTTLHTRDLATEYRYDAAGRLSRRIDANGQSTWYVYDTAGQLSEVINALGEVARSYYDADGRIAQVTSYVSRVDTSGFGDVVAEVNPTIRQEQRTYYVYDNDGRVRFVVRAENLTAWSITETRYDAVGNVSETRVYDKLFNDTLNPADPTLPSPIDVSLPVITVDMVDAELAALAYDDSKESTLANVRRTRYVYDADNRLRFTIDSLGYVTEQAYDDAGNLVKIERYAQAPTLTATDFTEDKVAGAVDSKNAQNHVTQMAYDRVGRLRYTVQVAAFDADGKATQQLVNERIYDDLGRVTQSIDYATPLGALDNYNEDTLTTALLSKTSAQDRRNAYAYDAVGRQIYSMRALTLNGVTKYLVTQNSYDDIGHITQTTVFAKTVALSNFLAATVKSAVAANLSDSQNRTTKIVYDAVGRDHFVVAPDGSFSEKVYDSLGQVTEVRQFNFTVGTTTVTEANLVALRGTHAVGDNLTRGERYTYDQVGRVLSTTDAQGYTETYQYNGLGDRVAVVDKNGALWQFDYDRLGRIFDTYSPSVTWELSDGRTFTQPIETRYYYDAFGNLVKKVEALHTSDARITQWEYDRLGRQIALSQPGYYDPTTGQVLPRPAENGLSFVRVVQFTYDAFGNVTSNKVRTGVNTYVFEYMTYDALGRKSYDVDVLNNVTGYTYNTFGEQITLTRYSVNVGTPPGTGVNKLWDTASLDTKVASDVNKRTITSEYDNLGRRTKVTQPIANQYYYTNTAVTSASSVVPVSAAASATYEYDVFGDVVHEAVSLDTRTQNIWHYFDTMGREIRSIDALGYHTSRTYDALGNLTGTVEYANAGLSGTSGVYTPPALPTESAKDRISAFTYNARNLMTSVQRKGLNYVLNSGDEVHNARNVATIVNTMEYDGVGHVVKQKDALDNVTQTVYDAAGRIAQIIEPTRSVSAPGVLDPFDPFAAHVNATPVTTFRFNIFQQIIRSDRNAGDGSGVRQITLNIYDFAGNLIRTTDANHITIDTNGTPDIADDTLQIDHRFDLVREYDYAGRVTKETKAFNDNDLLFSGIPFPNQYGNTMERRYVYDLAGRRIAELSVFLENGVLIQSGQSRVFDAFGQVTDEYAVKGTASQALGSLASYAIAHYEYDNAGHRITQIAANGTTKFYFNLAGQVTRQEQLGNGVTTDGTGTRISEMYFDLDGRATMQRLPTFKSIVADPNTGVDYQQRPTPVNPTIELTLDRWGNVLTRSNGAYTFDTNGTVFSDLRTTTYEYNHDNKLIAEHLQAVRTYKATATGAGATVTDSYMAAVTHSIGYDLMGNAVIETTSVADDPNTAANESNPFLSTRTRFLNSLGQVLLEQDASTVAMRYRYDAFGNRIGTMYGDGSVFVDRFDKNGNVISHGVLRQADGTSPYISAFFTGPAAAPRYVELNAYFYDALNRRVVTKTMVDNTSNGGAGSNFWTFSQYDERGLVRATVRTLLSSQSGPVTNRAYVMSQSDYDAFGNKTREVDAVNNVRTWTYNTAPVSGDYTFGQVVTADSGGRLTSYFFNDFGQVRQEIYSGGDMGAVNDRNYTYLDNGLLQGLVDHTSIGTPGPTGNVDYWSTTEQTDYDYNEHGERASEHYRSQGSYEHGATPGQGVGGSAVSPVVPTPFVEHTTRSEYDVLGRLINVASSAASGESMLASLDYYYDEFGNRRGISALYQANYEENGHVFFGEPQTRTQWYTYDGAGRVLISDGALQNGQIVAGPTGTKITYDLLGRRATAERMTAQATIHTDPVLTDNFEFLISTYWWDQYITEKYTYDDLGYVKEIDQKLTQRNKRVQDTYTPVFGGPSTSSTVIPLADAATGYVVKTINVYDFLGNVQRSDQWSDLGTFMHGGELSNLTPSELAKTIVYHYSNRVVASTVSTRDYKGADSIVSSTTDDSGKLLFSAYVQGELRDDSDFIFDSVEFTNQYNYDYVFVGGESKELRITMRTSKLDNNVDGITRSYYDARGNLIWQNIDTLSANHREVHFFNHDGDGYITRKEVYQTTTSEIGAIGGTSGQQDFFYNAGELVATIGSGVLEDSTLFNPSFTPLSNQTIGASPGAYTVSNGDSLSSIAKTVYGDSSLWYVIAEANSLSFGPGDVLPPQEIGKSYRIPKIVTGSHNNSGTFTPYNPSQIIGDHTPAMAVPPPSQSLCDTASHAVSEIVIQAVAIFVSEVVQAVLEAVAVPTPIAAGVGGAIGDITKQGLNILAGNESLSDFSWEEVGEAAAVSAATAGLGQIVNGFGLESEIVRYGIKQLGTAGIHELDSGLSGRGWGSVSGFAEGLALQFAVHGAVGTFSNDSDWWQTPTEQAFVNTTNHGWLWNGQFDWVQVSADVLAPYAYAGAKFAGRSVGASTGKWIRSEIDNHRRMEVTVPLPRPHPAQVAMGGDEPNVNVNLSISKSTGDVADSHPGLSGSSSSGSSGPNDDLAADLNARQEAIEHPGKPVVANMPDGSTTVWIADADGNAKRYDSSNPPPEGGVGVRVQAEPQAHAHDRTLEYSNLKDPSSYFGDAITVGDSHGGDISNLRRILTYDIGNVAPYNRQPRARWVGSNRGTENEHLLAFGGLKLIKGDFKTGQTDYKKSNYKEAPTIRLEKATSDYKTHGPGGDNEYTRDLKRRLAAGEKIDYGKLRWDAYTRTVRALQETNSAASSAQVARAFLAQDGHNFETQRLQDSGRIVRGKKYQSSTPDPRDLRGRSTAYDDGVSLEGIQKQGWGYSRPDGTIEGTLHNRRIEAFPRPRNAPPSQLAREVAVRKPMDFSSWVTGFKGIGNSLNHVMGIVGLADAGFTFLEALKKGDYETAAETGGVTAGIFALGKVAPEAMPYLLPAFAVQDVANHRDEYAREAVDFVQNTLGVDGSEHPYAGLAIAIGYTVGVSLGRAYMSGAAFLGRLMAELPNPQNTPELSWGEYALLLGNLGA